MVELVQKKQKGFTVIELVIVISIIGILAAVAVPRLIDITDDAHLATVEATKGALKTGHSNWRALWVVGNKPLTAVADGATQYFNTSGHIVGTTDADRVLSAVDCSEIFTDLLGTNAPAINATEVTNLAAAQADYNGNFDWYAGNAGGIATCDFFYVGAGDSITGKTLTYTVTTGAITGP